MDRAALHTHSAEHLTTVQGAGLNPYKIVEMWRNYLPHDVPKEYKNNVLYDMPSESVMATVKDEKGPGHSSGKR